ncbi:phosphoglycerate kinase [Psychroflexus halocasei]|uniref:Phosphoglycerate kinase n=1 Tax=Psychroflexus halocasei TaxID=908615 RepID=A0A1H4BGG4_9FLAO|nr:phosphoglycerate kinase [Psychroflexus halocasei]SEA47098.1 phosphoglycerate kinase [Psychroflexus halocasei]
MKTTEDYNFDGKKAIIRVDFNVPLNKDLEVTDISRIEAAKPTIIKVLEDGGSAILMSHLGRPKGVEDKFSLENIVNTVSDVIGVKVKFVKNCIGDQVEQAAAELKSGEVLMLENLRFHDEEKAGDKEFAQRLAKLADVYINDAFGTAHRAHASTTVIAQFFEDKIVGKLLQKEIDSLDKVLHSNEKPVTAIIGGAKVSSKITVIENILPKIDHLIIGGGMSFTFIKAQGGKIGKSLVEDDKLDLALKIIDKAKAENVELHLPVDVISTTDFNNDAETQVEKSNAISDDRMGLDVGPETNKLFAEVIKESKIILWNGPLGVFEMDNFKEGTISIGQAIGEATENGSFSLVGGGDSVAAAKKFDLADKMSYVSTGGGAMLEMLEGKSLPGIEALK